MNGNMKGKVKVGDILLNEHASDRNPCRVTIVYEITKDQVHCISVYKRKLNKTVYMKYVVNEDKAFKVIGHINLIDEIEKICVTAG